MRNNGQRGSRLPVGSLMKKFHTMTPGLHPEPGIPLSRPFNIYSWGTSNSKSAFFLSEERKFCVTSAWLFQFSQNLFYISLILWSLSWFNKVRTASGKLPNYFFFKDFIYLFIDTQRERSRNTGRGRSRLHAGSPTWDSIPGLQDHTPGCRRRQTAAPPGLPLPNFLRGKMTPNICWVKFYVLYINSMWM